MPALAPVVPPGPVSTPVDRYLHLSLYLMLITGFGTLAATGQLDLPAVLLVTTALLVRGYFLLTGKAFVITEGWNRSLALGYATFYFVDLLFLSRGFLTATVHLVLFGMVAKVFSAQRSRDHVLLALLSFAMILAAAVLTVDSTFFFAFSVFLLVAVATLILMEMQRSASAAPGSVATSPDQGKRLGFSLGGAAPVLLLLILVGAGAIFFLLPRISSGYLGAYTPQSEVSTGFSNEVRLGRIGEIQQSNSVVMHVEVEGDTTGSYDLRWRGVALRIFDGKAWSNPADQMVLERAPDGRYLLETRRGMQAKMEAGPGGNARLLHYRVFLEPLGTNVFFLVDRPHSVSGDYRMVTMDTAGAVFNSDRQRTIRTYVGESVLPAAGGIGEGPDNRYTVLPYLQVPPLDRRITQLAAAITQRETSDLGKAAAMEQYLRTRYGYTLELPATVPEDPLAQFLFERKRGHCEYFASAMAVMLRLIGIPSRVVNGFRGGEFNDVSGQYLIRARDAHSWVEAYLPERGWVAFDPTPAGGGVPRSRWNRILLYIDALSSFWQEWIVNYDLQHQRSLGEEALRKTRSVAGRLQDEGKAWYERLLASARRTRDSGLDSAPAWTYGGLALAVLVVLAANARRLQRWWRSFELARSPQKAPRQAATLWYERLTHWLNRKGWRREDQQTPKEFAAKIPDSRLRASVLDFTRHYEKARFGGSAEDAERLPELYEEITEK